MTRLCEQCRSLVATAFSGRMSATERAVESAAVMGPSPRLAGSDEYKFERVSEPVPAVESLDNEYQPAALESFDLDPQSVLETHTSDDAAAWLIETTIDTGADEPPLRTQLSEWDYSQGEWPVLLSPARRNPLARFKTALFVAAVLAIAAAFYFFLLPTLQEQRLKPAAQERAPVINEPALPDADSQIVKPSQTPPASSPTPTEPSNARGNFALQAAAFPTESEAAALADKLKVAGVPSYVVSADIARRGRWFRVRVGRFNTGEEAQRFAAEAQARANAAGMSSQFIVVPYGQP